MIAIRLEHEDWSRVLAVLSQAPWNVANPLIMSIGEQLRSQSQGAPPRPNGADVDAGIDVTDLGKRQ